MQSDLRAGSGTSVDLQPHLAGELIELRPLKPEDWNELFAVASDPLIWEQHPARDRYKEDVFKVFFHEALALGDCGSGGAFVVIDKASRRIIGSTRFAGYVPGFSGGGREHASGGGGEIEIGWTFLARTHWGGRYNGEMKRLMLAHAFKFVQRVIFLVGQNNIRSQKAVERIGGVKCGVVERIDPNGRLTHRLRYVITAPH